MSETPLLPGYDVLCFSSIDWQFIWQGHQEIMSALAASGNRVLFIENTGVRAPTLRDMPRLRARVSNWWRGTKGFRQVGDNLFVYSPLVLPFPYSWVARVINRTLLLRALTRWMRATGFARPVVWTFLPTPLVRDLVREIAPGLTVYYCIDNLPLSSHAARRVARSEEALFREADLVFVTSEKLRQRAARYRDDVHLFPFGVSYRKFERARESAEDPPADIASLPKPVAGYVGGVHRWIDFELLADVARRLPDVSFALVGPIQTDTSVIEGLLNVHLLGDRSHDEVPKYIKGFDVGLVPYRLTDYTANVYPTKLNEYLAMGIPVVATDLPEVRRFVAEHGTHVVIASGAVDFARAVSDVIGRTSDDGRAARVAVARQNSWEQRIREMAGLIRDTLAKQRSEDHWEEVLGGLYQRARRGLAGAVGSLLIVYVGLFQTELPWMLARPLRAAESPRAADAIVVFAGGVGESGKAGGGYQERLHLASDEGVITILYLYFWRESAINLGWLMNAHIPQTILVTS